MTKKWRAVIASPNLFGRKQSRILKWIAASAYRLPRNDVVWIFHQKMISLISDEVSIKLLI
jgi:hypothetical protein